MRLKLERPVIFFDLETTGTSIQNDHIVEYCFIKVMPDGSRNSISGLINPGVTIPPEVIEIHGISNEDVKDAPTFADKADFFIEFLSGCDFGGFNIINFDIPMMVQEFKRANKEFSFDNCNFLDAQKIFFKKEPRTLSAALRFYCDKEHEGAHGAEADVQATIDVLEAQLERYEDLPDSADALHKYCRECNPGWVEPSGRIRWINGEAAIGFRSNFEKCSLKEVVTDNRGKQFLKWIINNNFSLEVKQICQDALNGKFPVKGDA